MILSFSSSWTHLLKLKIYIQIYKYKYKYKYKYTNILIIHKIT